MSRARSLAAAALGALLALPCPALANELPADPFTRTGTFRALVSDDFGTGTSKSLYELETDEGEVLPLTFAAPPGARTGDRVSVTGWPGRNAFDVDFIQPLGRAPLGRTALSAWTTGAKRVLVILLNFTNDSSLTATTVTNAQNLYFGAGSSVARYYAEASYGLATMTGDVVLVTATVAKPTTCDTATIQSQANARALAAGYNPSNYQFPVWIFPSISACGWNGLGYVGGGGNWINGTGSMSLLVAAHELGHNFGVLHAHSYDCGTLTIAPSGCTRSEYGDRFDVMGNSRAGHFNAQFKDTFGWLPAGTVKVHAGGSATYTLGALEATGQSTYAVKIPTTGTTPARTYFVEWRNRTGFDAGEPTTIVNGALVRLAPSSVGGADLLDMTPATTTFDDAELDAPLVFTDPEVNLRITTVSKTASSITVQVDYGVPPPAMRFHTLTPCRLFDTRNATGTYGGPALSAGQTRSWVLRGQCGVPATARAIVGNLTATGPTAAASVRLAPGGSTATGTTTLSFKTGQTRANNVLSGLGASGDILIDGLASGTVDLVLDVVGWFE
jgi:hypothetical protein